MKKKKKELLLEVPRRSNKIIVNIIMTEIRGIETGIKFSFVLT